MTAVRKITRGKKSPPKPTKKKGGGASNSVTIPKTKSSPPEDLTDYIISIYGNSGCGKTSLLAEFPGYVIAQFESRRKGLSVRKVDCSYISIDDYGETDYRPFEKFYNFVNKAVDDPSVKGIAIDTFGLLFQSAEDYVCDNQGITHPNDANDYGKTWKKVQTVVRNILNMFLESGKGLAFIDHSTQVEVEVNDVKYWVTQPDLRDSGTGPLPIIKQMTDVVVYYEIESNGTRSMRLQPTKNIYCKSGIDNHFRSPNGELLTKFSVGDSPKKAYQDLVKAFNNKLSNVQKKKISRKQS